jgi:hypothetical protein
MRWAQNMSYMGEEKCTLSFGGETLGRQRRGGENTVMSLDEVGWEGLWGTAVAEDSEKSWPQ